MIKKFWCITLSLILLLLIICIGFTRPAFKGASASGLTVVIDPGHGGIDPGVTGSAYGTREADLNLAISKALRDCFYGEGVKALLTRTGDYGLYGTVSRGFKVRDLKKRVELAKKAGADIFISVHMNEYSSDKRRGAQVFYRAGDDASRALAKAIQSILNGLETQPKSFSALAGDYYVLNNLDCPAVIVECGFLSSRVDEGLFLEDAHRKRVAEAVFNGVMEYLS